jgi:hypothetical protein
LAHRTGGRSLAFVDTNVLIRGLTLPRFTYEVSRVGALGQAQLVTPQTTLAKARSYIETWFPAQLQLPEPDGPIQVLR